MHYYLARVPRLLLHFPFLVRLGIVVFSWMICQTGFFLLFASSHNGSILIIPVALAAWLLGKRGMLVCLASLSLSLAIGHTLSGIEWTFSNLLSFLIGLLTLLVQGIILGVLRDLLNAAEKSREKAELAEKQLALAYEQQYQLNQSREHLIKHVSHEFRTPLTEVYGYLELLLKQEHLDRPMQVTFLTNAMHGCEELELLIDNALNAMEMGDVQKAVSAEEFSLQNVVHDAIQYCAAQQKQRILQVEIEQPITVRANIQYVSHVLRNLLSNACKYTPEEATVIISAHAPLIEGASQEQQCLITLQDNGPGIPPEELATIFEPFARLKRDMLGNVRGVGLGLYTSRRLIEMMGGRLWVESTGISGQGCRFCFSLPLVGVSKSNEENGMGIERTTEAIPLLDHVERG